jgi:UDP-glucose 4-epimerase
MLRFANIYGPISAHKKGAITVFAKALIADEPFTIFGDGTATRDLLHVDDLCRGIIAAMEADLDPGTTMHLATGRETSVNEVATILKLAAGKPNHPIVYAPSRPAEVLRNFAQYDRANELIGFEPRVSLEKGLQDTWRWFAHLGEDAIAITATDS